MIRSTSYDIIAGELQLEKNGRRHLIRAKCQEGRNW